MCACFLFQAPVWSTIQGSRVGGVRYLDIGESKLPIMAWAPQLERLSCSLTVLDISGLGLMSFPPELACLTLLQSLHAHRNKLAKMPDNIGKMSKLKLLQVDHNLLETIPQASLLGNDLVALRVQSKQNRSSFNGNTTSYYV